MHTVPDHAVACLIAHQLYVCPFDGGTCTSQTPCSINCTYAATLTLQSLTPDQNYMHAAGATGHSCSSCFRAGRIRLHAPCMVSWPLLGVYPCSISPIQRSSLQPNLSTRVLLSSSHKVCFDSPTLVAPRFALQLGPAAIAGRTSSWIGPSVYGISNISVLLTQISVTAMSCR